MRWPPRPGRARGPAGLTCVPLSAYCWLWFQGFFCGTEDDFNDWCQQVKKVGGAPPPCGSEGPFSPAPLVLGCTASCAPCLVLGRQVRPCCDQSAGPDSAGGSLGFPVPSLGGEGWRASCLRTAPSSAHGAPDALCPADSCPSLEARCQCLSWWSGSLPTWPVLTS